MDKSQIVSILGVREEDIIEYEEEKGVIKVLFKFNGMYHVLYTEDITDTNEGSSVSTQTLEEAIEEYNNLK